MVQEQTMRERIIKSTCGMCQMGCGILVFMENGRPARIAGDPDHMVNKGTLCSKGEAALQLLYHPNRLKVPLKRTGKRGEGKWEEITWEHGLDFVAAQLNETKDRFGPESVVFIRGGSKGLQEDYLTRFGNLFGSPNISSMAHLCFMPRRNASVITYGYHARPDYEYPPNCLILWGINPLYTRIGEYRQIRDALNRGTKLIVIDPRKTELAEQAKIWLRVRPGTDLVLALAMLHVIIDENLYDDAFVDQWTVGFGELKAHVRPYAPEWAAEITWVPAEEIRKAARLYSTHKPACIQAGNGLDQGVNSFQNARALDLLRSITGNLGKPGGELKWAPLPVLPRSSPEISMLDKIPKEIRDRRMNAKDGLLPIVFYSLPQTVVQAILHGQPYPLHAAYIQGSNCLLSFSNAKETYKALSTIDFVAVSDLFMTPTAAMADVVLPVASFFEYDSISIPHYYQILSVQQKVARIDQCRSDYDILKGLAKRLGFGEYFPEDVTRFLDFILSSSGLTFDELRRIGCMAGPKLYRDYEKGGFETPSGKVELYSNRLKEWGFDPLPAYHEDPETPYSAPDLAKDYPLLFISWKSGYYRHSGGREIPTLRGLHPEPVLYIHPETASDLGIEAGDVVCVETVRGKIRQKAAFSEDLDPRVVGVDYGWWFPEQGISDMYGWKEANINILTNDKPPFNKEMGAPVLRGIACKVYPAP